MSTAVRERSDIPVQHKWNTETIFADQAAWEDALADVRRRLETAAEYQGRLGDDPDILVAWLKFVQILFQDAQRVFMYAYLEYSVDTEDPQAAGRLNQARTLLSDVQAAIAFAEPELIDMDSDTLDEWLETRPGLAIYRHYFETLQRKRPHIRSAEVEELLGQVSDAFSTASATHSVLTDSDLSFVPAHTSADETVTIAQSNISSLITSPDREVRRTAWAHYADAHLAFKNTMANCLLTGVKQDIFKARARRYDSSLEAALDAENIPVEVFHNLIDVYRANLPTWHRYWRVRRKALGLDVLREYDIKAPLTEKPVRVPYEQAVEWIAAGMAPLGEEYVSTLRRGTLEERWVDIYPNKGKSAGAYSYGGPGDHPFIMMSYTDDLFSLSTLAHELGHSMHSYYTWESQPLIYSHYSLFVAEVASNFNQSLVRAHLFETQDDPDFQIGLIEEAMANFHRYFFIMPTLARFELEIHERVERGDSFNADQLIELMADLFAEGYGDEVEMDRKRTGITWGEFSSHLYANFYVFQYATGISGAHALAQGVLEGKPGAAENYLAFLRAGSSLDPLDALKLAGVDLTTPDAVEQTFDVLAGLVDRLEALVAH